MKVFRISPGFSILSFFLLVLFLLSGLCSADATGSDLAAQNHSAFEDIDLVSFLNARSQHHDTIFMEALQLLESMKSSPSCNRVAATKLVASCQSIGEKVESSNPDTHLVLDRVKSLYAARLAICELSGAGTSIPSPCIPLTVAPQQSKGFFGFATKAKPQISISESIPTHALESCLKSLESRPQWWTSYSNSRQNALVICQAARIETEKDELLELHKSIVESTIKLNIGLQDALRKAATESDQHKVFMDTVGTMQARLNNELEENGFHFRRAAANILHDIESAIDSVMTSAVSVFRRIDVEANNLEKKIQNATHGAGHLQRILQAIQQETLARNEQAADAHKREVLANHELAVALRSSMESLLTSDIARLTHGMEQFDASLEWLASQLNLILQQEIQVSERLRDFDASLEESESKAERLRKAQSLQSEIIAAQSQAQENLQSNLQVAQALLDKATATAANLQAVVEETASRLRESSNLQGFFGKYSLWTLCALLSSIIGAHSLRSSIAVLLIGAIPFIVTRMPR